MWGRWLLRGTALLALLFTFASALVAGVLVHIGLPAARRAVLHRIDDALVTLAPDRVVIERIDRIDPYGFVLGAIDADVRPVGKVRARDVAVRVGWVTAIIHFLRTREIRLDVRRLTIASLELPDRLGAPLKVDLAGSAAIPPSRAMREITMHLAGRIFFGHSEARIQGDLDRERLSASIDLPDVAASDLAALVPAWPLRRDMRITLQASVDGSLSDLNGRARAHIGDAARANLTAEVHVAEAISGSASLESQGIDLAALLPKAPPSELGFFANLDFEQRDGAWQGTFSGHMARGWISTRNGGHRRLISTPPASFHGKVRRGQSVTGDFALTARERGTSVHVFAERQPDGAARGTLDARIRALTDLKALRSFGFSAAGAASVHAQAVLQEDKVQADLDLGVTHVRMGSTAFGTGRAAVSIRGERSSPSIQADVEATDLHAGEFDARRLELHADGRADRLHVRADGWGGTVDRVHAAAVVAATGPSAPSASEVSLRVVRNGITLDATADRLARAENGFAMRSVAIGGLGHPLHADLVGSSREMRARISAPAIDLSRAGRLAGIAKLRGSARAEVSIEADRSHAYASLHTTLADAAFGGLPPLDGGADALLEGDQMTLGLRLYGRDLGSMSLDGRARTRGSWLSKEGLARAEGRIVADVRTSSLDRVCRTFGCSPTLSALAIAARAHLDIDRNAAADKAAPETIAAIHLDASDPTGELFSSDFTARIDTSRWLAEGKLPSDTSFRGRLDVPRRAFDDLPAALRPPRFSGAIEMRASAEGTWGAPVLRLETNVDGLRARSPGQHQEVPALDARLIASYDARQAKADLVARTGNVEVLDAHTVIDAPLQQWFEKNSGGAFDWVGNVSLEANRFPLAFLPRFADRPIDGEISGQLSAERIHTPDPSIHGEAQIQRLSVGPRQAGSFECGLSADSHQFVVGVKASRSGPSLDGSARGGLVWQGGTMPSLDLDRTVSLDVRANTLDLGDWGSLLVPDWELAGTLTGQLHAEGMPRAGLESFHLSGDLQLNDASIFVLPLGRAITHLAAHATASPSGRVAFQAISGALGSGTFRASGDMTVAGSTWSRAHFDLEVPRTKPLPVLLEGVDYGTAWGKAALDATNQKDSIVSKVSFPTLHFDLTERDTGMLASTERNPHVSVAQPLDRDQARAQREARAAEEAAVGGGPRPRGAPPIPPPEPAEPPKVEYVFDVQLGKDVGIRRGDTQVDLGGNPVVKVDGDLEIDGYVTVLGGRVSVLGKTFNVDRGIVRFAGRDPTDPSLDVDASYQAQGVDVTVHLGGTAKQMKLDLKSDPPYTPSEILAIIAGTPIGGISSGPSATGGVMTTPPTEPGTSTQGSQSAASSAAASAGGMVLTSGLNQILSGSVIPIQASVGSSTAGTTKATAAVNVTERVRVEYIRQFGTVQYGAQVDLNSVAVDWQLSHSWVLRTLVGDRGTTILDVLWQRRY